MTQQTSKPFFSRVKERLVQTRRGFFESFKALVPKQERADWTRFDFRTYSERFDGYASQYPKVKSSLLSIAGKVAGEGVFLVESGDYPRAIEAKEICEKFNKRMGMYLKVRQTAYRLTKYGTAFWELDWNAVNGLSVQAIPHQKYMTPTFSELGEVVGWEYKVYAQPLYKWKPEQIIVFALDPEENPPFGTSLLTGIDYELNTQDEIRKNLLAYLKKQAWASNIVQIGDKDFHPLPAEISTITNEVKNREPGDDFVTGYTIENKVLGVANLETRMIPDTLKFGDDQVTDALMIAPVSKLYNSTEASSKTMENEENMRLIYPLQAIIAENLRTQVYQPLLEDMGYSVNTVPDVYFNPLDVHTNEEADYHVKLVTQIKCETPQQAAKELNIDYDDAYWEKLKQEEQQQAKMKQQNDGVPQKNEREEKKA